jgi:GMC oxidoreductase
MALDPSSPNLKLANHSGVMFAGYQMRPTTTSSVHLGGPQPGNPPVINAHFLEHDADRKATEPVLGIARDVFAKGPLADYVTGEDFPGPAVCSPDDVVRYALNTGSGIYHAVGASAMGPFAPSLISFLSSRPARAGLRRPSGRRIGHEAARLIRPRGAMPPVAGRRFRTGRGGRSRAPRNARRIARAVATP